MINLEALKETVDGILKKKQNELAEMKKDEFTDFNRMVLELEIREAVYVLEGFDLSKEELATRINSGKRRTISKSLRDALPDCRYDREQDAIVDRWDFILAGCEFLRRTK